VCSSDLGRDPPGLYILLLFYKVAHVEYKLLTRGVYQPVA
jgi:hypothetical protein